MYLYLVFAIRVLEFKKTNSNDLGKQKIRHASIAAIFWDNYSKILRPILPKKLDGERFKKINIKTVDMQQYIPTSSFNLFGEFQILRPNFAKRMNKNKI